MSVAVLTVPGYENSGPAHWQTLWERERPAYRRIVQDDWDRPDRIAWTARIDEAVRASRAPVVLLAHSCGATAAALWASTRGPGPVVGLFLVAPADTEAPDAIEPVRAFGPMPTGRLPVPSVLVASSDDPHLSLDRARVFGGLWGSRLVALAGAGHLNSDSGHGPWPDGLRMVDAFCREAAATHAEARYSPAT